MQRIHRIILATCLLYIVSVATVAQVPTPPPAEVKPEPLQQKTLTSMPVKEVSVFKDGYAFLLHEGTLPTDASGNVLLDNLPSPVLGTFWAYSRQPGATLSSVLAGVQPVTTERKALSLRELISANPNCEVIVNENGVKYSATLLGIGPKTPGIPEPIAPFSGLTTLLSKENTVYLRTPEGIREVDVARIQDIEFKSKPKTTVPQTQDRNIISLRMKWQDKAAKEAQVGMFYLQQGIRWIPEYQFTLDGKGNLTVKLQATLLNELLDLDDVTMRLVVGVPDFRFKGELDPIALQGTVARLSSHFQPGNNFSNAIRSQVTSNFGNNNMTNGAADDTQNVEAPANAAMYSGPELSGAEKMQDLYVFTLNNISMKKGQRMKVPIAEYTLSYEDIYTVELAAMPPREALLQMSSNYQRDIQQRPTTPVVKHILRIRNTNDYPITTAPVLVMQDGKPLAQSMTSYTTSKGMLDLELTTAIDINVRQSEQEVSRTQNAAQWQAPGRTEMVPLARVDLAGSIKLTNLRGTPTHIEVTRRLAGNISSADHDGKVTMLGLLNNTGNDTQISFPYWWAWFTWPDWWMRYNGLGQVTWNVTLQPKENVELGYKWNYLWQ